MHVGQALPSIMVAVHDVSTSTYPVCLLLLQSVHSLDLVAAAPGVIACNMAQSPLAAGSCDAAVFSLALMGTDYGEFLLDAARVLKEGGWLWIAEVGRSLLVHPFYISGYKLAL